MYCTYTLDTEQEVWPENVELYEPCKGNLIFLVTFVLVFKDQYMHVICQTFPDYPGVLILDTAQNNLPVSCTISLNLVNEDVFELYCMISQISPKYKIVFFL